MTNTAPTASYPFSASFTFSYDFYLLGMGFLTNADINADGKMDLIQSTYLYGNGVSVWLGNGDGSFGTATTTTLASKPYSVSVADVNGDGKLDVVTANGDRAELTLLLGNGKGNFIAQNTIASELGARFVTYGDVNADGKRGCPGFCVNGFNYRLGIRSSN